LKGFSGVEIWKTLPHPVYLKLNEICPNFWGMLTYEHYIITYKSYGVLSVTVDEVKSISPLSSTEDNIPFDGHCYVDFTSDISKNQKTKKAGKLRDIAVKRTWTFKPER
jgi:hypothetical protein